MVYKKILLIALLFTYTLSSVVAQNSAFFESANKAYNEGNYKEAISDYHNIIDSGMESFELYFNLGNAYYKINDVANSIYYYEKAALIDEEHPSLSVNLAYANQMTIDAINQKSESGISKVFNEFIRSVELNTWSVLSIVFMLLFVSFYLFFLLWNDTRIKRISFTLSILVLLLSLSSYGLAARHQRLEAKDRPAIVFENTLVKAEPNDRGAKLFELHLGTKVQIVDQMGDWTQIQLADGQQGWLLDQSIKALK
jgi:tetratricopeptide (TPR) repeat protein